MHVLFFFVLVLVLDSNPAHSLGICFTRLVLIAQAPRP
jgi:hypothetical protein